MKNIISKIKDKEIFKTIWGKTKIALNNALAAVKRLPLKYKILGAFLLFAYFYLWGMWATIINNIIAMRDINIDPVGFTFNPFVLFVRIFINGTSCGIGFLLNLVVIILFGLWHYRNHRNEPKWKLIYRNGKFIRMVTDDGTLSTDRELTISEIEDNFTVSYTPNEQSETIFGKIPTDKRTVMMPIPEPNEIPNRNSILFGSAGCGKTTCYIYNYILQCIKAEEIMVITDPSGEICSNTYKLLKDNDYRIKVLNTKNPAHSDSWNFIGDVGTDFALAQIFANTIIENTNTGAKQDQFWNDGMTNLLTALILYVNHVGKGANTIKRVTEIVSNSTTDELKNMFASIDQNSPAMKAFNVFQKSEKISEQVINNLGIRLRIFMDPERAILTSKDDIHILDLAKNEKIAIFIITNELDNTYSLISALFLDASFKILTEYAANKTPNERLPKPVNFVFDEFCNIGKIHDAGQKISTARKYNIVMVMVVQSLPQFQREDRYSKEESEEIIGNCLYKLCFSASDLTTAQYFSDMSGEMTCLTMQKTTDAPILNTTTNQRSTLQKRAVFTRGEILSMNRRQFLLFTTNMYCTLLDKVFFKELDEFKKMTSEDIFPANEYQGSISALDIMAEKKQPEIDENEKEKSKGKGKGKGKKKSDDEQPAVKNNSLYDNEGNIKIPMLKEKENEQRAEQLDLLNMSDTQDLETMFNKIPEELPQPNWVSYIQIYNTVIKQKGKMYVFCTRPNINKRVFLIQFASYSPQVKLPLVQLRAEGEMIDITAMTKNEKIIKVESDVFYIDYWHCIKNKDKKNTGEKWELDGTIYKMPPNNITLVPHFAKRNQPKKKEKNTYYDKPKRIPDEAPKNTAEETTDDSNEFDNLGGGFNL